MTGTRIAGGRRIGVRRDLAWTCTLAVFCATAACSSGPDTEVGVYRPPAASPTATADPPLTGPVEEPPIGNPPPAPPEAPVEPPVYDPNVRFEWLETAPTPGECLAGVYQGDFLCVLSGGFFSNSPITGPITFTLRESSDGEFLEISEGTLVGIAGLVVFVADVVGQLDCSTGSFSAASANGTFPGGTFSGNLVGTLNKQTQTLAGQWSFAASGLAPCDGLWSVRRVP